MTPETPATAEPRTKAGRALAPLLRDRGLDHAILEIEAEAVAPWREALVKVMASGHTNVNLEGSLCRCVVHEDARALLAPEGSEP